MNINNISTNFLKLSQQLNFDREEEEAPEPFVWTDERTSLDVESENEYWSKNDVVYNLDLLKIREPKHSEIPYNFSFDLEYLKAPKLTREFLEQIEKNHIYDKELGLQKAIKDKNSAINSIIHSHVINKNLWNQLNQIIISQTEYVDWFMKDANISELKRNIKRFFIQQNFPKTIAESSADLIVNEIVKLYKDNFSLM